MKGQGALEYLMTYGWALLIIVIVGVAIYTLVLPATQQTRCTGFQYFMYKDQLLTSTSYTIDIANGASDVNITAMTIGGNSVSITPELLSASSRTNLSGSVTTGKSAGDSYTYSVVISYDVVGGIAGHTDTATCTGVTQ